MSYSCFSPWRAVRTALLAAVSLAASLSAATQLYEVEQKVSVDGIASGAQKLVFWVSIPDNERYQSLLDFSVVDVPGTWEVVRDLDRGNRFLRFEVAQPAAKVSAVVRFRVAREAVSTKVDPAQVGAVTATHRQLYAEELRLDAPHMAVTSQVQKMADEACGAETNVYRQAQLLLARVADYADHYSKDPSKPKCGIGSSGDCLTNAGGCCTDLHSLFISLARAKGIPARLQMGYRLREANAGKEVDPGYRCWVEYFVPNYGWVSADIVEADDPKGLGRDTWFTGLTNRRVWLNEGREFRFAGRAAGAEPVNTMIIGHAEIDGVPARVLPDVAADLPAQLTRTVKYTELGVE